jgi:hypothetical protein
LNDYDKNGNAKHYQGRIEVIDMMERIWGTEATMIHCEMTAFKYRMRMGKKSSETVSQDTVKAIWYDNKARELEDKLNRK